MDNLPAALMNIAPIGLMLGLMYFLSIRPQQQKMRQHQDMLNALKAGDQVVTSSGMKGRITRIQEGYVQLEISQGVVVDFEKSHVVKKAA